MGRRNWARVPHDEYGAAWRKGFKGWCRSGERLERGRQVQYGETKRMVGCVLGWAGAGPWQVNERGPCTAQLLYQIQIHTC